MVQEGKGEKYLGQTITQGMTEMIIDENIKQKRKKLQPVIQKIRKLVRYKKILRIGALRAAVLMLQRQICPILTYGTESWLGVTKNQYQRIRT